MARVGGIISLQINGVREQAAGQFTFNDGAPIREAAVGADGVHGYMEKPGTPFIEGAIRLRPGLNVRELKATVDGEVSLELGSGQVFILRDAWYAGEGNITTEAGEVAARFEGLSGDLVDA